MTVRLAAVAAVVAAGVLLPLPVSHSPAPWSPLTAARMVEQGSGPTNLPWGKLRAWRRTPEGWLLLWQPSHGSWLLSAHVEDKRGTVRWRVQAAPWLPGVRLSEALARSVLGAQETDAALRWEGLSRRDWEFGGQRLAGAVLLGEEVPERVPRQLGLWPALLLGAVLVGALCLVVLPGQLTQGWTLGLVGTLVALVAVAPSIVALGYGAFRVGVRPWVAQLALFAGLVVGCAALAVFAVHFGMLRGRPRVEELAAAAAAGLLAGRAAPVELLTAAAGLTARPLVWLAVALGVSYLAALAGIGLRELLHPLRRVRPVVLVGLAVWAFQTAGPWLGPTVSAFIAAAVARHRAMWTTTVSTAAWIVGCTLASCAWPEPVRDAGLVWLVGSATLIGWAVADR